MNKVKIEIKNRWTGNVLFEYEKENNTMKDTLLEAIRQNIDLRGSDLRDSDLRDSDLRDSDLSRSDLRGSDLRGSDLRDSDLSGCDLSGSSLSGCDLSGCDLKGSNLRGAYIYYDDNKINIEEQLKHFENKNNVKITDYHINECIYPTRWNCFWNYGLIIKDYKIIEKKEKLFDLENATENEKYLLEKLNELKENKNE